MKFLRRILGVLVMIAGIMGLLLSLAGLAGVWVLKPDVSAFIESTISTLNSSIVTSQQAVVITSQALQATVDSLDALSVMLGATSASVDDTKPVLDQVNILLGEKMPASIESAISSLESAQQGAAVLDSAIKSLDSFRAVMSAVPLVSAFVDTPAETYDPDVPLAESLGGLAASLEDLPQLFTEMSADMDKADNNLVTIGASLDTMSSSVGMISESLSGYMVMVEDSKSSMDNLSLMLAGLQTNLTPILDGAAIALTLFFAWLLAAQVVILTQGWELYQGTASRMEGKFEMAPAQEDESEAPTTNEAESGPSKTTDEEQ